MDLARFVANRSRDPSTKVGAVIVRPDNTQVSFGYNGFPKGVDDAPERYEDRDFKLAVVVHAEENALDHAREPLDGYTLYVSPLHPCAKCAGRIVSKGIKRVVTDMGDIPDRWKANMDMATTVLREGGVEVVFLPRREA